MSSPDISLKNEVNSEFSEFGNPSPQNIKIDIANKVFELVHKDESFIKKLYSRFIEKDAEKTIKAVSEIISATGLQHRDLDKIPKTVSLIYNNIPSKFIKKEASQLDHFIEIIKKKNLPEILHNIAQDKWGIEKETILTKTILKLIELEK